MGEANAPNTPPSPEERDQRSLRHSAARALDNPPLLEERDLNSAETKVLEAFREGWEAGARHIIVCDGITEESIEGLTAEKPTANDWPGAILRASFLRSLFLGSYDNFAPRLVTIACARIEGRLDLDYCEARFPLSFFWCIFSERISLRAATISDLVLTKCLINQDKQGSSLFAMQAKVTTNVALNKQFVAYGKVDLNGADIGGQLACDGGYFGNGLTAQDLKTGASVFLKDEFKSNGEVCLRSAGIGGQLDCGGGYFENGLIAQDMKTGESVLLREGFKSNGQVDLNGVNIGGHLSCAGGHFEEGLQAQGLKADGAVLLNEKFKANGEVNLLSANIGWNLNCDGGYFKKGLAARKLKTSDDVSLSIQLDFYYPAEQPGESALYSYNDFESGGDVDLSGADIGKQFYCNNGRFEKRLRVRNLKTGAGVFLASVFNGEVDLSGANISRQLDCDGGRFEEGLTAPNLKTGEGVRLCDDFDSRGNVNLSGADIGGQFTCSVDNLRKNLIADSLRYQTIDLDGEWEKGLAWLHEIRGDEFQPYEQLMAVYRRMGHPDWAREIGFELEKKRHERSEGGWRAWYSVLKWTIGYGYRPFRFLGWAVGLVTAGFLLFSSGHDGIVSRIASSYLNAPVSLDNTFLANEWIPSEDEALKYWGEKKQAGEKGQVPQDYPKFNPFVYSLEATLPVLPLGQLSKWHPKNIYIRVVRWVWIFTGSGLLAILALFGVGFLGPNRKSEGDGG